MKLGGRSTRDSLPEPVAGMLQVPGARNESRAAAGRQVRGGRQRRGGGGSRQAARPGGGGSAGAEQAVPGRVGGAAERRRAGRVGELDRDGLEQRAAGVRWHDAVELLDGALGLVSAIKPHEPDALRQTCDTRPANDRLPKNLLKPVYTIQPVVKPVVQPVAQKLTQLTPLRYISEKKSGKIGSLPRLLPALICQMGSNTPASRHSYGIDLSPELFY